MKVSRGLATGSHATLGGRPARSVATCYTICNPNRCPQAAAFGEWFAAITFFVFIASYYRDFSKYHVKVTLESATQPSTQAIFLPTAVSDASYVDERLSETEFK